MKIQITIGLSEELKEFISEILGKEAGVRKPAALKAVPKEEPAGEETETTPVVKKKKKIVDPAAGAETQDETKPDLLGGAKKATTIDDVRATLQPIVDGGGFSKVQKALKELGAESLLTLDASKYDDLIKKVMG